MNSTEFTYLLKNSENITAEQTESLNEILNEYPYFQAARATQLKGYNKTNNFKYNQALKKTAAYTIDRKVLFDFITSFSLTNNSSKNIEILEDIEVIEPETVKILHKKITDSYVTTVEESEATPLKNIISEAQEAHKVLETGKPLQFSSFEPHSFNEWMQLISQKPILREEKQNLAIPNNDKFTIIDKFIKSNPKIKPVDKNTTFTDISLESSSDDESLMTETLAKVYLEQKKYEKAIKAYRILILKYPEKSGFFADRIKAIKILQKNKS
jgi:tetratricopeptide (TPR) repeat protein